MTFSKGLRNLVHLSPLRVCSAFPQLSLKKTTELSTGR